MARDILQNFGRNHKQTFRFYFLFYLQTLIVDLDRYIFSVKLSTCRIKQINQSHFIIKEFYYKELENLSQLICQFFPTCIC